MTEKEKRILCQWVKENLVPRKTPNFRHTSYGLKHLAESATGVYSTNDEFKEVMEASGYEACNKHSINWSYAISERSPAFRSILGGRAWRA